LGYNLLKKVSPNGDPYKKIKQKSNRLALKLYNKLKSKVNRSEERLLTAVELAIAGNIIDFGVKNNLNVNLELNRILLKEEEYARKRTLFHYQEFKKALKMAKTVLYLADNAGEVVFDRILIEEIKTMYPEKTIYFAVKNKPIINDALFEDAKYCGIDKFAKVLSNGSDAPGTILRLCSNDFKRIYRKADVIISKGQGNFESLSNEKRPIFFFFMVKCGVVAKETRAKLADIALIYNLKKSATFRNKKIPSKNITQKVRLFK
ncbi:MAG: DUF89 family protein, partial [Candidatus Omnitrophica bacterium]|nr:DUF89 family protein [Candidatus Omnitrophota bacterium]